MAFNLLHFSSHTPGQEPNGVTTRIVDQDGQIRNGDIDLSLIDYDFLDDYGVKIIAGRGFSQAITADTTSALILNEAAVQAFGYTDPEDIIGASFEQWGGNGTVVGVINNFNYMSLHQDVGLLSLKMWPDQYQKISIKVAAGDLKETLPVLRDKWISLYPDIPFNYYFVNDDFRRQYEADEQFANIIVIFTSISVIIGILGLVAFATFWCDRRKKEIAIRNVLGANAIKLILNLYKGFSFPVVLSFLIGMPIAYYFGNIWLQQFAYQIEISWPVVLFPLVVLMIIIWISVGFQTIAVVLTNPAKNLSEE